MNNIKQPFLLLTLLTYALTADINSAANEDHADESVVNSDHSSSNKNQSSIDAEHGSSSDDAHHAEHHAHEHETLIFLFGAVVFGTGIVHLSTHPWFHSLQFTVVLFVIGVICALIIEQNGGGDGNMVVRSWNAWVAIDPHLLLFTFLPALLAGDAMTIDTHVARRCAGQCMLLAGPGVIIGAVSTALVLCTILPWGWDFMTSLMVGAILAATDPVAVVALLKELGAPPQLTVMIQGESLLNDGIAIVLFTVAYEIVGGEEYGAGRVMSFLLKSTIGASCIGIAIGVFFYLWIYKANDRLNHSSPIIQICLTLACAYWSFIFAEGVCHVSGVLSTVCASLVLAHKMWPVLVDRRAMLEIWHVIETIGNTLVFFLAGAMTGKAMMAIEFSDYIWVLVVYVAVTIIRLVMLLFFLPFLNVLGQKVSTRDVAIMTWGGLRGMVGLALAILVKKDKANGQVSDIDGDRVLFLCGSIAALTLIVNATTCPALTKKLGITQAPEGRNVLIRNVEKSARKHVYDIMWKEMADRNLSKTYLPGIVRDLLQEFTANVKHHLPGHGDHDDNSSDGHDHDEHHEPSRDVKDTSIFHALFHEPENAGDVSYLLLDFDRWKERMLAAQGAHGIIAKFQFGKQLEDIKKMLKSTPINAGTLRIVREVFLEAVRASYWEQLENGRFPVGGQEPTILLNSVNLAKEGCGTRLADWNYVKEEIYFEMRSQNVQDEPSSRRNVWTKSKKAGTSYSLTTESCESKSSLSSSNWRKWIHNQRLDKNLKQQTTAIQVITGFIAAHEVAQARIAEYFGDGAEIDSPEEAFVILESQVEVFKASATSGAIDRNVHLRVNTMWHAVRLAEEYRKYVHHVTDSGVLHEKEAEVLLHPIADTMRGWEQKRRKIFRSMVEHKQTAPVSEVDAVLFVQRAWRKLKDGAKIKGERGSGVFDLRVLVDGDADGAGDDVDAGANPNEEQDPDPTDERDPATQDSTTGEEEGTSDGQAMSLPKAATHVLKPAAAIALPSEFTGTEEAFGVVDNMDALAKPSKAMSSKNSEEGSKLGSCECSLGSCAPNQ
eukprot:gnl/MRDRNA2_/MRDRNA2_85766_c1_seq1.p1 gnl/MRDRNA2_/MRDRNA2_85766_c1~~gnl/MRDRNA2_/MRDRNA2_85766_c1_seq1.p1  ORF type:complete len:1057 (-),score=190.90 gnl/MRDRNA2_/MRDRNA2_85766_c1_seq1:192-3362(-)